jgi:hypothetical protein
MSCFFGFAFHFDRSQSIVVGVSAVLPIMSSIKSCSLSLSSLSVTSSLQLIRSLSVSVQVMLLVLAMQLMMIIMCLRMHPTHEEMQVPLVMMIDIVIQRSMRFITVSTFAIRGFNFFLGSLSLIRKSSQSSICAFFFILSTLTPDATTNSQTTTSFHHQGNREFIIVHSSLVINILLFPHSTALPIIHFQLGSPPVILHR